VYAFRDNRKRRKGRNNSGSSTMMRNKTQVACSDIMSDMISESEVKMKSEN
jgi:hypothetical protein